jgi:hypothetical protein
MAAPPLSVGAVQLIFTSPDVPVALAVPMVGASGFAVEVGVAEPEGSDGAPQPFLLYA